jgi:hypothetical protein
MMVHLKKEKKLPHLATLILKKTIPQEIQYSALGDFEEIYHHMVKDKGVLRAQVWYWYQTLKSLPSFIFDSFYWKITLFRNFFRIAIRNIIRNRMYSIISILGLALAVGCFTLPFAVHMFNKSIDQFHEHGQRIFYITSRIGKSGSERLWGVTPAPLGPSLKQNHPQIEDFVRITRGSAVVSIKTKNFKERLYFTDPSFLEIFSFPVISGNPSALGKGNHVIITNTLAEKYFGDANPIGEELVISNEKDYKKSFIVGAVVEKPPKVSSLQFDILISLKTLPVWDGSNLYSWAKWVHTFIVPKNKDDISALTHQIMGQYIQSQNEVEKSWPIRSFVFDVLPDISEHSRQVSGDLGRPGFPPETMVSLWGFGILVLLLACFNFINVGIVTGTRRLPEIGIRKVLGSGRSMLIQQFMGEHILICLFALVLGVIFAQAWLLPFFSTMFYAPLKLGFFDSPKIWIFFGLTLLITVIGSGGYPALYVSRFNPINILRRTEKVLGGSKISKIILIFQFTLTFLVIGTSLIFIQNAKFLRNLDWGYNQKGLIGVFLKEKNQFEVLKNAMSQHPDILTISGTEHHIGKLWVTETVKQKEQEYAVTSFKVGHDYLDTMQVRIKEGRTFLPEMGADKRTVIVNQTLARAIGETDVVGRSLKLGNEIYTVIGMVEDFRYRPFTKPIKPVIIRLAQPENYRILCLRAGRGKLSKVAGFLEKTWKQLFPDKLYESFHQDTIWDGYFETDTGVSLLSFFLGMIALLISCMGLFGMISINLVKRIKEISIRKVFGANIKNIVELMGKTLIGVMVISALIATPLCYLFTVDILDSYFSVRIPITVTPFLLSSLLVIGISIITVISPILRAANVNIIDNLREN